MGILNHLGIKLTSFDAEIALQTSFQGLIIAQNTKFNKAFLQLNEPLS